VGSFKGIPRASGKRNYSIAPATYKDLAYIIDAGRGANFSKSGIKVVQGSNFIKKAWRNSKSWKKKREIYFKVELDVLGEKLNED
jgi:hypothetical protein